MFGKPEIIKAIKKGDLESVKKILAAEPYIAEDTFRFSWPDKGNLLHAAAYFGQAPIVKFLIENKYIKSIDRYGGSYTALHYAAITKAHDAAKTLLEFGANPCLRDGIDKFPYEECRDQELKKLLYTAYQEWGRPKQEQPKIEEKSAETPPPPEEKETAAEEPASKTAGTWVLSEDPDEVIFELDMKAQRLRITETFNFAAELRILIVQNLETGNLSQPETKSFEDIPKRAEQAGQEFVRLGGKISSAQPTLVKHSTGKIVMHQ